jgi:hypothetical protein
VTISHCSAKGIVYGGSAVGGLIGYNTNNTIINTCSTEVSVYASGDISCNNMGGLIGYNYGTVSHCYAWGEIQGQSCLGGLIGQNSGTVSYCYATGKLNTGSVTGGLIGHNYSGTVTNCFWDREATGIDTAINYIYSGTIENVVGKTTEQMKLSSTFTLAGWDFMDETINGTEDIWRMCTDGINYPRLTWEFDNYGDWMCPDGVNIEDVDILSACWLETVQAKSDINNDNAVNL